MTDTMLWVVCHSAKTTSIGRRWEGGSIHRFGVGKDASKRVISLTRRYEPVRSHRGIRWQVFASISTEPADIQKAHLLASVAPLDKGLLGTKEQADSIENQIFSLLDASSAVRLDAGSTTGQDSMLCGSWTLLYSSEFIPGNTKFPGNYPTLSNNRKPFVGFLPKIKNVEQYIDCERKRLDNIVQVELRPSILDGLLPNPAPSVEVCLGHSYKVLGAQTMKITFDESSLKGAGGLNNWLASLPELSFSRDNNDSNFLTALTNTPALDDYKSSSFDVVYLDEDTRITRGDRGEIRIFLKKLA